MKAKNETVPDPMQEIMVSRQPIFNKKKDVFAYELLFRWDLPGSIKTMKDRRTARDDSSLVAIDSLLVNGLKRLSTGKRVIIYFNRRALLSEFPLMFPSDLLGIEIQEDADPEHKVTEVIKKMKKAGYLVLMTDQVYNEGEINLVKMADIVGVDFHSRGIQKRVSVFGDNSTFPRFLARGVKTPSDFELAAEAGYHYFQGEFFCKEVLISFRNIPSYKLNLMRILKEINRPSVQFDKIEKILQKDVSITYKLLRFVNSAFFGLKTTVQSIRHALALLGEIEVRKCLSFIVLSSIGTDKPLELIRCTIIRAKFCEYIAAELGFKSDQANFFLMGMFSMVNAFLDRPMEEILEDLPLASPVKAALLGNPNHFRDVLELVKDYERGDWTSLHQLNQRLNIKEKKIAALYLDAVEWGTYF
ncbi:MAG: HDOD domain-containing protein [Candidatus Aminicenantes bacterium]|jgi:EAL and modified HD-GYP domain-containing signal transduction protein